MTEFVDTNILFYAHDPQSAKHRTAVDLLSRLYEEGTGHLSTQVLIEFYSVAQKKLRLSAAEVEEIIRDFADWHLHRPAHADLLRASELHSRYQLSWFDALIVNSAIQLGCTTLWTEDLADGQQFGPVTIRNPFTA